MGMCNDKRKEPKEQITLIQNHRAPFLDINDFYKFENLLGQGTFGIVRKAFSVNDYSSYKDRKHYAIKTINKQRVGKKYLIQGELETLLELDHPNIVRFFETYEDQVYIHFVMEYCSGGSILQNFPASGNMMNEIQAAQIMKQLFSAVSYIHSKGIAHRDLKPENMMFTQEGDIKLIDFGLSKKFNQNDVERGLKRQQSMVGTPFYMAPEIFNGCYDISCDNWSLGCILYFLLSGDTPFRGYDIKQQFQLVKNEQLIFTNDKWRNISPDAKQLISQLLEKDPSKRISSMEALKNSWIEKQLQIYSQIHTELISPINIQIINMLKKYSKFSKLKKESLKILLNKIKPINFKNITKKFGSLDLDNNGEISVQELWIVMKGLGLVDTKKDIERLIKRLSSQQQNTYLKYSEFLAATLNYKIFLHQENLKLLFFHFDIRDRGYIQVQDVDKVFQREGIVLTNDEIFEICQDINQNQDGRMNFQEFCNMMLKSDYRNEEFKCSKTQNNYYQF